MYVSLYFVALCIVYLKKTNSALAAYHPAHKSRLKNPWTLLNPIVNVNNMYYLFIYFFNNFI